MKWIARILIAASLIVPLGLFRGWILSILWGWFAVPMGLPALGVAHVWGLALLIGLATYQSRINLASEELEFSEIVVSSLVEGTSVCTIVLGAGYIAHAIASAS